VSNALRRLQQRGAWETASGFWISISGSALGDPGFGQFLIAELTRFKVPADRLCLQITEAAITADMTASSRFTELLAPYGVLFAVDEFNAGLSSFRALSLGPLRFLKFDSALFPRISSSPLDFALVKAINDVAHSANIQTVVKQLEETKTLLDFQVIGTDFLQGASVSRPEPLNALQLKAEALAP
jgi:Amt family ammonium transporter